MKGKRGDAPPLSSAWPVSANLLFSYTIIVNTSTRTLRVHRHVRTPCAMCSFPMYRYLLPTYCDEYRGAFSGPSKDGNLFVLIRFQLLACTADFNYAHLRFRRSQSPRESPRVWSRKNSYCYVGVWLYYATFSGPKRESAKLGAADYKILLYATPKSTIKLISSLTTCIISFSLKAQRYLSCCAQVCVCMCVCVYELCVSYQVYIKFVGVCICI